MAPDNRASPRRVHAAPSLLSHLRTPTTASTATSIEASQGESLPHSPTLAKLARAPSRSPSALSLAHSSTSGRVGRTRASARASAQAAAVDQAVAETLSRPAAAPADDDVASESSSSSSARTRSRASSSSSLDGLAARLDEARKGKGRGLVIDQEDAPTADGSAPSRKSKERASSRDNEPKRRTGATLPRSTSQTAEAAPGSSSPSTFAVAASAYDLPRTGADSPALSLSSASKRTTDGADASTFQDAEIASEDEEAEEDDDDDASSLLSVTRAEAQGPDPRSLLRAQLARTPSARADAVPRPQRSVSSRSADAGRWAEANTSTGEKGGTDAASTTQSKLVTPLQARRYFVLSTAGKLVYTSDVDEESATGLVGVMQAIVSIFADESDKIRYIDAGSTRISFLLKPPLYLVVVSSLGEPESLLRQHLDYLHQQVLSVVTLAQLQAIFKKHSNFDLRRLMEGTEPFFDSLTASLQTSLPILLSSIEVYRLPPAIRDDLSRALNPGKEIVRELDLLYVLLLAKGRLVTLLRPKKHSIHPTDLHILLSTIYAPRTTPLPPSPSASPAPDSPPSAPAEPRKSRPSPLLEPDAESWLPICLPRFNARGFLHAYVSFFDSPSSASSRTRSNGSDPDIAAPAPEDGIGLVLLSSQREAFEGVAGAARSIRSRLLGSSSADGGLVHHVQMGAAAQAPSLGELGVPGVRHFVYKERGLVQVVEARWEGEYAFEVGGEGERARMRLITLYQHLHDVLHPRSAAAGTAYRPPAQVQYLRTEHEAVLGWVTPQFELYLATSPLLPHSAVVSAARAVSRWVKKEEKALFLHGAGTF